MSKNNNLQHKRTENFKYGFDDGMEWFHMGRAALLDGDREIPIRLVALGGLGVQNDYWIFQDKDQKPGYDRRRPFN